MREWSHAWTGSHLNDRVVPDRPGTQPGWLVACLDQDGHCSRTFDHVAFVHCRHILSWRRGDHESHPVVGCLNLRPGRVGNGHRHDLADRRLGMLVGIGLWSPGHRVARTCIVDIAHAPDRLRRQIRRSKPWMGIRKRAKSSICRLNVRFTQPDGALRSMGRR